MHKFLHEYPDAHKDRIREAERIFPYKSMSPEEYAAREGHNWACFSFDDYIYPDTVLNEWIHTLGDIFSVPGKTKELRLKYLTSEEIKQAEDYENDL